jgi:ABC-2 type transport system ATP-binding protein
MIEARGIRKRFGRHEVLRGIDLAIAPGEVVGLIGANGAGKTTLMSCLLDFLYPDAGQIVFDGLRNRDLRIRRRTGFVPERMSFGRRTTGWQFLRYMARLSGIDARHVRPRAVAMLDRLGLTAAADRPLGEYSRGMLQRIALSQALIHEPDFLFLDEPASGLDPNGVLLVRDLIAEQKQRGAAVLLNSHQLAEVEKVCDRVLFLHGGVVARAESLRADDRRVVSIRLLPGTYDAVSVKRITGSEIEDGVVNVSAASDADIAAVVGALVRSGASVVEVRPQTADLEALFRGVA